MRTDWIISGGCHLAVLITALVGFSPARLPATPVDKIAVNIVTDTTKSEVPRGQTNAKEAATPFAEKIDVPNPVVNPNAKISPREVSASTDTPQSSPPEPKQAKSKPEPKRDLIAEALKKDAIAKKTEQKKADTKKADTKTPTPPKRPATKQDQRKFDPREMQALLDKRNAQRKEATGTTVSDNMSLGARSTAAHLSQGELDALKARLAQLWNPPVGARNPDELVVTIRIKLRPDGTLDGMPGLMKRSGTPAGDVSAMSAIRAVRDGQPFTMLKPENYEAWKDIEITFDPRDMIRG